MRSKRIEDFDGELAYTIFYEVVDEFIQIENNTTNFEVPYTFFTSLEDEGKNSMGMHA